MAVTPDGLVGGRYFGIAQLADSTRLTASRTTIGTAAYLAPEQIGGTAVTGAADVYALGLVLVEALSGHRVFDGTNHEMLAARMTSDPYIPPVVPSAWVRLLRALTRRDPDSRPDATVVAALLPLIALAAFFLASTSDGRSDPPADSAGSSTTASTASTTSSSTTTTPTAALPPGPQAAAPLASTCAELDDQKQALDGEKQRIDETYRHDREARDALKDR